MVKRHLQKYITRTFKLCVITLTLVICLSPGGRLLCSLLRSPIVFNLGVIGVVKVVWGFKNTSDDRPFRKLENVLSPGGRLLCRLLRGPFVFNLGFIELDYRTWGFKIFYGEMCF